MIHLICKSRNLAWKTSSDCCRPAPSPKSEDRVVLRVDDLRLKERVTTRISSGKSASFYRLPSCGCYAVVDEIAFILPIKD